MAITNIGLRISGTKQRQAGFAPLANAGVLAGGEGENMDRVPLVTESPAYVVKHAAEYILYLLIDRRVRSFDADAPGVLSIALTIPSDSQLKDNKSPYTLLKEVYNTFVSNFMDEASDGRNTFRNVDSRESMLFRDIVANYSLEPRRTAYVTMNPSGISGIVCVPETNLEDFFRNTQYKEFAPFKDIEVGSACHSQITPGLERLQIPLPSASYEVWVNGDNTGATMVSPTDFYRASASPTKFYTYESVEFTLSELLSAPNGQLLKNNSRIVLEPDKNRISCTLKKFDILYDLTVEWKEKDYGCRKVIEENARRGNLRLMLGDEDITRVLYTQELMSFRATEINGKTVSIKPSRMVGDYIVDASSLKMDDVNHKIVVLITVGKKATKPVDYGKKDPMDKGRRIPIGNNLKDDPDYFKGGDGQEQSPKQPEQQKAMIDIKSFCLGTIVGLLLGLAIWFLVGSEFFGGDKKKDSGPEKNPVTESVIDQNGVGEGTGSTSASLLSDEMKPEDGVDYEENEEDLTNDKHDNITGGSDEDHDSKRLLDEENAKKKLEKAEAEKKRKEENEKNRKEILALVNKKDLVGCRNHKGWDDLPEKNAVEAVLDLTKYKKTNKKEVVKCLNEKYNHFNSLAEVVKAQKDIRDIINNKSDN